MRPRRSAHRIGQHLSPRDVVDEDLATLLAGVARELSAARLGMGLSQERVAHEAGVAVSTY